MNGIELRLPASFSAARHRLTLEALEPLHLPPFKGSALRGGFGITFKRLVCANAWPCGERCEGGNACPYGYIFETKPPEGSDALKKNEHVPHPFVIEPPADSRAEYAPGEQLIFDVVLVGKAQEYMDYFAVTFKELGRAGLGRGRGKFRVAKIKALDTLTTSDLEARAAELPTGQIRLRFLTPTRLVHDKEMVQDPPFHVLVRRLLDRVSSLSYFHCGERWETDFKGLIAQAEQVELAEARTRWVQVERFSGRQQERVSLGGFVGEVAYKGDIAPFRALLLLGSLAHVGKATVFGNGKYEIERGDGDREER